MSFDVWRWLLEMESLNLPAPLPAQRYVIGALSVHTRERRALGGPSRWNVSIQATESYRCPILIPRMADPLRGRAFRVVRAIADLPGRQSTGDFEPVVRFFRSVEFTARLPTLDGVRTLAIKVAAFGLAHSSRTFLAVFP